MSTRALLLLAFSYLLVLSLVAFGVPLAVTLADRTDGEIRALARSQANIVAASAAELEPAGTTAGLRRLVTAAGTPVRGRVVLVDARGVVVADSATARSVGARYATPSRPEISAALAGRQLQERRRSRSLGRELLVTAAPVLDARGRVRGAVRITQSVSAVDRAVRRNVLGLAAVGGAVLLLGLLAATLLARRLSAPLTDLRRAADRVAAGDLETVAAVRGPREQRALANAFNTMTARVARNLEAQQEFVADASHQLRTPLTGLRLRLEEAEAEAHGDGAAHLRAATVELDRLSHTIDELLILSRGGERDAPGAVVDLGAAADAVAARWEAAAEERGHSLTVVRGPTVASVHCAPVDLERALDGVVENAIRYTPAGGHLELVVHADGIDVTDDGPGVPATELPLVLERFRRGLGGRSAGPGTGLGLTISRQLMRRWDGDLTLIPRTEGGLRVRLTLPPRRRPTDGRGPSVQAMRSAGLWIAIGIVGLGATGAATYATSHLSHQAVGQPSAPPLAGADLAPRALRAVDRTPNPTKLRPARRQASAHAKRAKARPTTTVAPPVTPSTVITPQPAPPPARAPTVTRAAPPPAPPAAATPHGDDAKRSSHHAEHDHRSDSGDD